MPLGDARPILWGGPQPCQEFPWDPVRRTDLILDSEQPLPRMKRMREVARPWSEGPIGRHAGRPFARHGRDFRPIAFPAAGC